MTSITPYGGVGEIGGNKLLLETKERKLLLDFGKCYGKWRKYYEWPFVLPRKEEADLRELIEFGIVPEPAGKLEGVYSTNVLFGKGEEDPPAPIDSCLISHAHGDHWGYISLLNRNISLWMSEASWRIIHSYYEHRHATTIENELRGFEKGENVFPLRGEVAKVFEGVECVAVDHSIPGSLAYLIETESGLLVYTGDLRRHGPYREGTDRLVEEASGCRYLLCDCTNLEEGETRTEEDVLEGLVRTMRKYADGLVMVSMSSVDSDRVHTVYRACEETGRQLVISMKPAATLARLADLNVKNFPDLSKISVYDPYGEEGRPRGWRKEFLMGVRHREKGSEEARYGSLYGGAVTTEEILERKKDLALLTSFGSIEELREFYRKGGSGCLRGGIFVFSTSEPMSEELEMRYERLESWILEVGMPYCRIHCSGHCYFPELKELVEEISPAYFIPIHCEKPELAKKLMGYEKTLILKPGVPTELP